MPRPAFLVTLANECGSESAVGPSPCRRRRALDDRRADERMPEDEAPVQHVDQPGVLGRLERSEAAPARQRFRHELELPGIREREGDQCLARGGRQTCRHRGVHALDVLADWQRLRDALEPGQLLRGQETRQLDEAERVAAGGTDQPFGDVGRDGIACDVFEQPAGGVRVEAPERDHVEAGAEGRRVVVTDRHEDGNRVHREPTGRERQGSDRGGVDPLGIVEHDEQWAALGDEGEQTERCRTDREAIGSRRRGPQRGAECGRLVLGQIVETGEDRTTELGQARVLELDLGFDPHGLHDGHRLAEIGRVSEQRGLPHAGLAAKNEGAAVPAARSGQ
jgi:hypothetical protein